MFVILLFIGLAGFTQTKPSFISVNAGPSFPTGDYAGTRDLTNDGFAKLGLNYFAEGAWFFSPNFGIGANWGYSTHALDESALSRIKAGEQGIVSATYTSDPYKVTTLMAGIYGNIPLSGHLALTFKLLAGRFAAKWPKQSITYNTAIDSSLQHRSTEGASASKFSVMAGAGFRYNLSHRIGISLQAAYTGAKPKFEVNLGGETANIEQKFGMVNLTAGVNFLIGK